MTDHEHPDDQIEWPREIWMGEREEHDQGVVTAVLSEHATVARWEGDKERDREFHRYVDADIHESAERYYKARIAAAEAERDEADRRAGAAEREMERLKESARRRNGWLSRAKQERGYDDTVSFDVVWKETCDKADTSALDEALAAEREKCAQIAETRWKQWTDDSGVECDATACEEIAAAIRRGDQA